MLFNPLLTSEAGGETGCVIEPASAFVNKLYFGDNLDVLGEYVADESIDLIYLDPPFNSQARYNVLFETPKDEAATAQAQAFRDTWTWLEDAQDSYLEIMRQGGNTARFIDALKTALHESDMMAYLVMMAIRLRSLHRKLKPTGTLYLHCDPTASHYLKVVLDGIFGPKSFLSEVIWKRTGAHGNAKRWAPVHDVILVYTRADNTQVDS
jgi:site-specific DNA-methyltransferase (adenine-specific)